MSRLIETHSARNPRLLLFFGIVTVLLLTLVGGLAYQQLFKTVFYNQRERQQSEHRVVVPGPRGNIYDRNGAVLVENRPRFSVVLDLAQLRSEFRSEYTKVSDNYRKQFSKEERPTSDQISQIARAAVVQRYLDKVNSILGRTETVHSAELKRQIDQKLLLPYVLLDDLAPKEYARLIEELPVTSPLQVYLSTTRYYPFGSAAAHTLGYVSINDDPDVEDFPGEGLSTVKMKGSIGKTGLEKLYEDQLQGETGGAIYRVDHAGYKVDLPIEEIPARQGHNITTSLDIDLQLAAESALTDPVQRTGAAVAIDVKTGEILAITSKPDYDLNSFVPHLSQDEAAKIADDGAWFNQAIAGAYPPGSTFKILTSIAAMHSGKVSPDQPIIDCEGVTMVGNKRFYCENGDGHHGNILLPEAIAESCDIFFYQAGLLTTVEGLAAEAKRFHLDQRTGIEIPGETGRMVIPDPEWKEKSQKERWFPGDTANMSIGQGYVLVTPLEMACFAASIARNELFTKPTILHDPNAPTQHAPPIGLTPAQRAALLEGMEGCTTHGTGNWLTRMANLRVPGIRIAGKTGTAQKRVTKDGKTGNINYAWFICFAPIENPEIAVSVVVEGETIGENFGGGTNALPVASAVLKKYFEKKAIASNTEKRKYEVQ
ncbi:MAG TPA: penicillin-binding transpeptidase domain-containing protein [Lacunisphaera sp.]